MKLSNYRRIIATDYSDEYKELVDRLGTSLNNDIDQIHEALNNKITFADNISCTIADLGVTVGADGIPTRSTSFKLNPKQLTILGILATNAFGANNPNILPSSGIFISFTKNEGYVTIDNIKGLLPNIPYTLKILCI